MNLRTRRNRGILIMAALLAAPATAGAQQSSLPEARQLVARYVEAIGGREPVLSQGSSRSVGTFEMPAMGIRGEMEILAARPNLMKTVITIPGLGAIRSGFDGTVGWEVSPMTGARLYEGNELTAMLERLDPRAAVRDAALFRSMETVERTEMAGQPCYRVRLVWQSGREAFDCYHVESGLMVASTSTQESPMGTMTMTTTFGEFQTFGGVRMPTRMEQQVMGQTQVMTLKEVEFETLDAAAFTPPAEIRALKPAGT